MLFQKESQLFRRGKKDNYFELCFTVNEQQKIFPYSKYVNDTPVFLHRFFCWCLAIFLIRSVFSDTVLIEETLDGGAYFIVNTSNCGDFFWNL